MFSDEDEEDEDPLFGLSERPTKKLQVNNPKGVSKPLIPLRKDTKANHSKQTNIIDAFNKYSEKRGDSALVSQLGFDFTIDKANENEKNNLENMLDSIGESIDAIRELKRIHYETEEKLANENEIRKRVDEFLNGNLNPNFKLEHNKEYNDLFEDLQNRFTKGKEVPKVFKFFINKGKIDDKLKVDERHYQYDHFIKTNNIKYVMNFPKSKLVVEPLNKFLTDLGCDYRIVKKVEEKFDSRYDLCKPLSCQVLKFIKMVPLFTSKFKVYRVLTLMSIDESVLHNNEHIPGSPFNLKQLIVNTILEHVDTNEALRKQCCDFQLEPEYMIKFIKGLEVTDDAQREVQLIYINQIVFNFLIGKTDIVYHVDEYISHVISLTETRVSSAASEEELKLVLWQMECLRMLFDFNSRSILENPRVCEYLRSCEILKNEYLINCPNRYSVTIPKTEGILKHIINILHEELGNSQIDDFFAVAN